MKCITNSEISISVVDMKPARKKPCLCVIKGNVITKYASFNNEQSSDEFMDVLAQFTGAKQNE